MESIYLNFTICKVVGEDKTFIFNEKERYINTSSVKYAEVDDDEMIISYTDGVSEIFILKNIFNVSNDELKVGWKYLKNYNEVIEIIKLSKLSVKK